MAIYLGPVAIKEHWFARTRLVAGTPFIRTFVCSSALGVGVDGSLLGSCSSNSSDYGDDEEESRQEPFALIAIELGKDEDVDVVRHRLVHEPSDFDIIVIRWFVMRARSEMLMRGANTLKRRMKLTRCYQTRVAR